MKICIVGSGAREHCLAVSLSKFSNSVVVTPGNPGMDMSYSSLNIATDLNDPTDIDADLFVIGPEGPLSEGIVDKLKGQSKVVFGPDQQGAQLESSKIWMKAALKQAGIPTADFKVFDEFVAASNYLKTLRGGYVIKTDGLAAGKGVFVTKDYDLALKDLQDKMNGTSFGQAGKRVVIEELMEGQEISVMALTDGKKIVPLSPAVDAKRCFDDDLGPNTGGMGAYSPPDFVHDDMLDKILEKCIEPLLGVFKSKGIDYRGVLYAGLMLTPEGPKVVEFNVRFGDPETQAILPGLESDLASLIYQASLGKLTDEPKFNKNKTINVVLATNGYPDSPTLGDKIYFKEDIDDIVERADSNVRIFFAGVTTKPDDDGLFTSSGRVMSVACTDTTFENAKLKVYDQISKISFDKMHFRKDIGKKAIEFETGKLK